MLPILLTGLGLQKNYALLVLFAQKNQESNVAHTN